MTDTNELASLTQAIEFLINESESLIERLLQMEFDSDPYRLSLAWLRAQALPYLEGANDQDASVLDDQNLAPLLTTFSLILTQSAGFLEYLSEQSESDLTPPINLADRRP